MPTKACPQCHNEFDALTNQRIFCSTACQRTHEAELHPTRQRNKKRRYEVRRRMRQQGKSLPRCRRCGKEFWAPTRRTKYCYNPACRLAHRREENKKFEEIARRRRGVEPRNFQRRPARQVFKWGDIQNAPAGRTQEVIEAILEQAHG